MLASVGETTVLATATSSAPRGGGDFFPLTVDVEERMYAAGKIPGGFFRREGKASEKATLLARLIDRPMRPAFPDGFRNEVHVVVTVSVGRRLEPDGHPRGQCRVGGAVAVGHAVRGTGRLRAPEPHRRAVGREPDVHRRGRLDDRARRRRTQERLRARSTS